MKQRREVKIEFLPPGICCGCSPNVKDRYFSGWKFEVVGEGKRRDIKRESYLRSILKGV